MGALAPGSAHARPSAQALIDNSGNFSGQKIENISEIFSPFHAILSKSPPRGAGGPPNFIYHKSYFVCDLMPHAKFRNHTITPSGRKLTRRKERNNGVNSGPLVS
jgi:hypothetical protein